MTAAVISQERPKAQRPVSRRFLLDRNAYVKWRLSGRFIGNEAFTESPGASKQVDDSKGVGQDRFSKFQTQPYSS